MLWSISCWAANKTFASWLQSLHEMFGAFIGLEMQQRIVSHDASLQGSGNYWLVRRAAAAAMSQGWIQIRLGQGDKVILRRFLFRRLYAFYGMIG